MVRETTIDDIRHVVARMRADDVEEQFACRFAAPEFWDGGLSNDLVNLRARAIMSFCFLDRAGQSAAILSAYLQSPGVARLHRIATDNWREVSIEVFRFGIERFMPALSAAVHRAECSILAKHNAARLMLQRLGFHMEGVAWKRGRNGEDFLNMAWVKR